MDDGRRILSAIALSALAACSSSAPSIAQVGFPAPPFSQPQLSGRPLSLGALRGKAVYLNFFATWCPPCNEEAPAIDALSRRYAGRGLAVVGVDVLENAQKAASFTRAHHLSYPVLVDNGAMTDRYGVNGLPVHVFIDRSGVVRRIVDGEMSAPEIRSAVNRLLQ
jgi:cytochrome c biogenesis protein CcmG/thiol:disulfide interchange protein DsbE